MYDYLVEFISTIMYKKFECVHFKQWKRNEIVYYYYYYGECLNSDDRKTKKRNKNDSNEEKTKSLLIQSKKTKKINTQIDKIFRYECTLWECFSFLSLNTLNSFSYDKYTKYRYQTYTYIELNRIYHAHFKWNLFFVCVYVGNWDENDDGDNNKRK